MEKNLFNTLPETKVKLVYSKLAEMVLNRALRDFRQEQIRKEIDRTLQDGNKEEFLRLTVELEHIS